MKAIIVYSIKAKTHILNAFLKVNLFKVCDKYHERTF